MKKFLCSMLCGITLFGSVLLAGCGDAPKSEPYTDLKATIYEIQQNSEDLYRDEIEIIGVSHSQYNGSTTNFLSSYVKLQDIVLTDNCILERPECYLAKYWLYFDVETIKFNSEVIYQRK